MVQAIASILSDFAQLFYPHSCSGCGTDIVDKDQLLCLRCLDALPITNFHFHSGNQVEKIFWGRLPITHATSLCYFNSGSLIQTLLHQLKYKGNKELGYFLGRVIGDTIIQSNRFNHIDALIPLPLFASRLKQRGYNQAELLCDGMAEKMHIPVLTDIICRPKATATQTKKNRLARWENMEGKFSISNARAIEGKHVVLVDDVITTGATLEACGSEILKIPEVRLSIVTLAYTIK